MRDASSSPGDRVAFLTAVAEIPEDTCWFYDRFRIIDEAIKEWRARLQSTIGSRPSSPISSFHFVDLQRQRAPTKPTPRHRTRHSAKNNAPHYLTYRGWLGGIQTVDRCCRDNLASCDQTRTLDHSHPGERPHAYLFGHRCAPVEEESASRTNDVRDPLRAASLE
jgi:hypothetical protein